MDVFTTLDKVRAHFTPARPIKSPEHFKGRVSELQTIVSAVGNAGQHVLIFGPRSVGKTSLAYVSTSVATVRYKDLKILKFSCDESTTFTSIAQRLARALALPVLETETELSGN